VMTDSKNNKSYYQFSVIL